MPEYECFQTQMSLQGIPHPNKLQFRHYFITLMSQCYNEWELEHSSDKSTMNVVHRVCSLDSKSSEVIQ